MKSFLNSRTNQFAKLPICQFASRLAGLPIRKSSTLIVFLLSLSFLVSTNSFSQEIEWQKTIGGSSGDNFSRIKKTDDGGYILAGSSSSNISGDKTENCFGGSDFWILKTDSLSNIQWQNTIGGSDFDYLYSIQQTSDGGFILGGMSMSDISGDKSENCFGNWDYWIVKIDSVGNILWQNTIGGSADDRFYIVFQTADGGYLLGGSSTSSISGDKSENCLGGFDYWIVKTDTAGNIQWQNTLGGSSSDRLYGIEQTSDGGYILGGYSNSNISGDKTENCLGSDDFWLVKVDGLGDVQWQKTIGGSATDYLYAIRKTNDNGFILGGASNSDISFNKTKDSYGGLDYWVLKTDSNGVVLWQNSFGGFVNDELFTIQLSDDGGYLLGGRSYSNISGNKMENNIGDSDYWIVKTDSLGNMLWQNTIGGNDFDMLTAIEETNDGGIIIGGYSDSNISGDKEESSLGNIDFWILKLTDKVNSITGHLVGDLNSNGIQDIGEPTITLKRITEQNTSNFSFSDQNGFYNLSVLDTGYFLLIPQLIYWYTPVPISHVANFSGIQQVDSLNDFRFQPQGTFEDVCVTINPMGIFRSGFTATYMINYVNYGSTIVAPTVYFYPHSHVTYQSATLPPSNITPDSVVWNLPALTPFQTGSIIVTVNVNLGLPIGTLINSSAHIEPYLTDDNPSCNNSNWEVYTTGSFDPNDILVSEDTLTTTQLSNAPWLDYIIRFQNTGNDTAFTVKILNPIDTFKLNISTIEFVNASHPVNLNWINYQRNMEFKFENILLVDSNTNEPLSHGFVRYRIQPKINLNAGDTIPNFAAIYFDFNEPIITNTAKTIIFLPTGILTASPARGKLLVFPNPTENTLNVSGYQLENGKAQLRLTDIYGKLIIEKTITSKTTTLETNALSSGIYLIQSGELRATFVKQ